MSTFTVGQVVAYPSGTRATVVSVAAGVTVQHSTGWRDWYSYRDATLILTTTTEGEHQMITSNELHEAFGPRAMNPPAEAGVVLQVTPSRENPGQFEVRASKGARILVRHKCSAAQVAGFDFEAEWLNPIRPGARR